MIRNIGKYFLFFFFFVFTLSLVNISPLFAKKEKEADKTAVDTDVCKKDTTKSGAEQYSAKCKEQCTSTDTKFAKFKEDNKEACTLLQALTATTTTDNPAITKEQQEIERLVQNVVEKLNKIEDTAENTAALEAIIPEFPSPTSKEFTITFSDKLRKVLEAIIFPQSAPESTATIAFVLNEATTTPATDEKKPATAEKTPIQVRAEAAIKTIILKSFDPLTDTTGKYYKEVIQELRDHWLNVDLKGDYKEKDTPFTVANFKAAIFGSKGYSLPHELYHFDFDEALTKAIKDNAEAEAAKKAFLEAYKKYIETNTKIEIQSDTWKEGQPLQFKISLNYDNALLDPGIKCTDVKFAQFKEDNTAACKLIEYANADAAKNAGTAKTEHDKAESEKNIAVSKSTEAKKAANSTYALGFAKDADTAAKNADTAAKNADAAAKEAEYGVKLVPTTAANHAAEADTAAKNARDAADAARDAANEAFEAVITKAKTEAEGEKEKAENATTSTADAAEAAKKAEIAADNAEEALKFIPKGAANRAKAKTNEKAARDAATAARDAANTKAGNDAGAAKTEHDNAEAEKNIAVSKSTKAKKATNSTDALGFAKDADTAAKKADYFATKAEAAATKTKAAAKDAKDAVTKAEADRNRTADRDDVRNAKKAEAFYSIAASAKNAATAARTAANEARTAANEALVAVTTKANDEASAALDKALKPDTNSTDALVEAKKAETAANNAEAALALIPEGTADRDKAQNAATSARNSANKAFWHVITKAKKEAEVGRDKAKNADNSADALAFAQTANTAVDNAEKARSTANLNYYLVNGARQVANKAFWYVITKAKKEAEAERDKAKNADTSTDALGFARTADTAAKRAKAAFNLIPTWSLNKNAKTEAGFARTASNKAVWHVITKAKKEAEADRDKAQNAANSTDALVEAKKADKAAKNAEDARDLIPATDADANTKAANEAGAVRTLANEAALAVITKANTESIVALTAARGATDSTLALVEAKKADKAADNAEAALLLIPQGAAGRGEAETNARNVRSFANQAAQAVISKAQTEAAGYAQTAAGVTPANVRAAGNRAAALLVAAPARTAANNADASAKNAEAARDLIPATDPARADANTNAGRARTSATNADNSADAAEAAVPNS